MSLDHILLGLLREPQSGYELKAAFDRSLNYFWPAELSQIYRTLKRLEADGLLKSRGEPSEKGPDRRVYSLSRAGRRALGEWLERDPVFGDERFTYLAQVFFMAECGDLDRTQEFVRQMQDAFDHRLETLQQIDKEWSSGDAPYPAIESEEGFHYHLTLRMGLSRLRAASGWCDETIERIEQRKKSRSRGDHKQRSRKCQRNK